MVYLSGFSQLVHQLLPGATCDAYGFFGKSRARSRLYSMSSLVSSRPVWKVTPLRRLTLILLRSLLCSQLSARRGIGVRSSAYSIKVSFTAPVVLLAVGAHWKASVVKMSPTWPQRK